MEFRFNTDKVLPQEFNCVDNTLIIKGWQSTTRNRVEYQQLYEIINLIGEASSFAQGLNRVITSADKLQNSDHLLYLMKEREQNSDRTLVVGMLKIGRKKLFLLDQKQNTKEVAPLCVLDFYIHESRQRRGYGRRLFDHMLIHQNIDPSHMAVDKPSDKFLLFLKKHYGLDKQVPQINNFVVYDSFFNNGRPVAADEVAMTFVNRSNRSSRTASPDGSPVPSPGGSRRSSSSGFAGKPSRQRDSSIPLHSLFNEIDAQDMFYDQLYTSDILHGKVDNSVHTSIRVGNKHQTTLDWMRGSSGGESPFSRTPKSYSPSRTPSYAGTPMARTPRDVSPQRSNPSTPPKRASRNQSTDRLDVADGIAEGSAAPTPATSPERRVRTVEPHEEKRNGEVESVRDKLEEISVADSTELGKTGGWRDSVSRDSDGLVDHMSTAKGSTMTGVLHDNDSVHGHLKFHHHALW